GGLLAIVILYLFLRNGSSTFIIAVSIPISIIATFALLYFNGLTLNQMSFGGLALGVGLIVDNAIVVLENIIRLRKERGKDLETSALVGTREVGGEIVGSTLTTCVIFIPVVFMQTVSGTLFQRTEQIVDFQFACCLFIALKRVTSLCSKFLKVKPAGSEQAKKKNWFQRYFAILEHKYAKLVEQTLDRRSLVFGITGVLVVVSVLLIPVIPV